MSENGECVEVTYTEHDIATARLFAEKLISKQAEAGKWLLGSLLIVNGGALVALFSNEAVGPVMLKAASTYFVFGIVMSFVAGSGSYIFNDVVANQYLSKVGIKVTVLDESSSLSDEKVLGSIASLAILIGALGSLGAFIGGAVAASNAAYSEATSAADQATSAADNALNAANAAMSAAMDMANNMANSHD